MSREEILFVVINFFLLIHCSLSFTLYTVFFCFSLADYGGHGNSFHGSGGRGNKRAQMRFCLRLIRSMVSVGDDGLNQDLVDQGAINQIVGKFCDLCVAKIFYRHRSHRIVIYLCVFCRNTFECQHQS